MRGFGSLIRKLVMLFWVMWILGIYMPAAICVASGQGTITFGEYTDGNGITYAYTKSSDNNIVVIGISNYEGKIVDIPAEIDGYPVTKLGFKTDCIFQRQSILWMSLFLQIHI